MIIIHFSGSIDAYDEAEECPGRTMLPDCCPTCKSTGQMIKWGVYRRWCTSGQNEYCLVIQRVRCKVCECTHALLPDFLHPYRHYALDMLYKVIQLYLLGYTYRRIHELLLELKPAYTTIQKWVAAFTFGAHILLPGLASDLTTLGLECDLSPPKALIRIIKPKQRQQRKQAHQFLSWSEQLYAWAKNRQARLHFSAESLLSFMLHWLQKKGLPPRIFWHEGLPGTPNVPF